MLCLINEQCKGDRNSGTTPWSRNLDKTRGKTHSDSVVEVWGAIYYRPSTYFLTEKNIKRLIRRRMGADTRKTSAAIFQPLLTKKVPNQLYGVVWILMACAFSPPGRLLYAKLDDWLWTCFIIASYNIQNSIVENVCVVSADLLRLISDFIGICTRCENALWSSFDRLNFSYYRMIFHHIIHYIIYYHIIL